MRARAHYAAWVLVVLLSLAFAVGELFLGNYKAALAGADGAK